jgi:peptidyl-prolyl cis-trans isomerase A (cyclophilin A)
MLVAVSRTRNAWRFGRLAALSVAVGLLFSSPAHCTVVQFNTVLGSVIVRLYDSATPQNVANFLHYLNSGLYNGTFFHRDIPGFVLQGGGYAYNASSGTAPHIATFAPVQNEFRVSNLRGTIAMAKLGGDPNSATSEFFFNLSDSNAGAPPDGLDYQNGGFTVFGRVLGSGMNVVDNIVSLPIFDLDPDPAGTPPQNRHTTFDNVPLRNGATLSDALVFINSVQVLNVSPGDFDGSGSVTKNDYALWRETFGSKILAEADGNGNGGVDLADYVTWRKSAGAAGAAELSGAGVPEPASVALILVGGLMLPFYLRRLSARRKLETR